MNHGTSTLAEVENVVRHYAGPRESLFGQRRFVHAVDGIDLVIHQGEAVGLVGESGCGKSTVGRLLQGIESPTSGRVRVDGIDVSDLDAAGRRNLGRHVQTIYQNPVGSLDPRVRIGRQIREPLDIHKVGTPAERRDRVIDLLDNVGLSARYADRFPHEVSGGEAQRIVIARALTLKPKLIICDEPVSSLDVAIQRQVVRLLTDIKDRFNVAYLFISHDLRTRRDHVPWADRRRRGNREHLPPAGASLHPGTPVCRPAAGPPSARGGVPVDRGRSEPERCPARVSSEHTLSLCRRGLPQLRSCPGSDGALPAGCLPLRRVTGESATMG